MQELKQELSTLSKERVFHEFEKALSSNKPSAFFDTLKKANVLEIHFKEIQDLIGALQPLKYHPEGDAYNHTMIVVDKSVELTDNLGIRFAALVHDLGKGVTSKEEYPHHYGHDEKGVELVQSLGNRIGVPKMWIAYGKVAVKEHMKGGIFSNMTVAKKVSFIERISKSKLGLHGLQIVVICDKCSTRNIPTETLEFEKIGQECINEINGEYIKKKYGVEEGILLANRLHQERILWLKEKLKKT